MNDSNTSINMTNSQIRSVENHVFSSKDRLFLDTNVLLWIYGRQVPSKAKDETEEDARYNKLYTDADKMIRAKNSAVYFNTVVISEFATVSMRKRFGRQQLKKLQQKKEKDSGLCSAAEDVRKDVVLILSRENGHLLDDSFSKVMLLEVFDEFVQKSAEFNDLIIARMCRNHGLTLMTDDVDFANRGIPILTANENMLSHVR